MPNMEKATEAFILVIALLPVVARLLLAGISPQAARISEDRRAVFVFLAVYAAIVTAAELYSPWALRS